MGQRIQRGAPLAAAIAVLGMASAACQTSTVTHTEVSMGPPWPEHVTNNAVDKIDLLFMIDNSPGMGDKQSLLAAAVPDMITRLVEPRCLDANGAPTGQNSAPDGTCPANSKAEFPPVHDMHIGIVTSSLGGRGGDVCQPTTMNPANTALNAHQDDRGELINRGGANETIVPNAQSSHFLSWFPTVTQNMGKPAPPTPPETIAGAPGMGGTLVGDFTTMVQGVHEHGCGFEAQNEAWYRFLIQPDPFDTILQQRHDFLRPDSLVAVIVVTDENEEVADPLAVNGQGSAFDMMSFPKSSNGQAPQGTIECARPVDRANPTTTGPYSPSCTSCAFIPRDSAFDARCPKDGTAGVDGYLDPANDPLNLRFFQQKRRFGVFAGYPITRYERGLTRPTVPDRTHEHDSSGTYWGDQDANANCVNPLFAQNLPTDPTKQELCVLTRGARTPDLVYYAAIAGVPHQLLQEDPANPDSPQRDITTFSASDWDKIQGGHDPEHYDFSGADFHMIESPLPRTGGNVPPGVVNASNCGATDPAGNVTAANNCDPINGQEWWTGKEDLQFSCIFPLATPKDCSQAPSDECDCPATFEPSLFAPQLCDPANQTRQINGNAYPSVREMEIAHFMAGQGWGQGIVSSVCPIHATEQVPGDPLYGYRPAVNAIVDRFKQSLTTPCFSEKLTKDSAGSVACLILVAFDAKAGKGATCKNPGAACDSTHGLIGPSASCPANATNCLAQDVLDAFCDAQRAAAGPQAATDPLTIPVCAIKQLTPKANAGDFAGGSCASSTDPGWCYVTSTDATKCPQSIVYAHNTEPQGSSTYLLCVPPLSP